MDRYGKIKYKPHETVWRRNHTAEVGEITWSNFGDLTCNLPVPVAARFRRISAAACLLRLWVRIPPEAWMSVCCECCVLSGRALCDELITRPEVSYHLWCVVVCDLETSCLRRHWPTGVGGGGLLRQRNVICLHLDRILQTCIVFCSVRRVWSPSICCYKRKPNIISDNWVELKGSKVCWRS